MVHTIRRAEPRDLPFVAWVQQEAARSHLPFGFWDLAFPGPDTYRLRLIERIASLEPASFTHWSRFLVAEVDGEPAAALSAYDDAQAASGESFFRAVVEAMTAEGWNAERLGAMQQRLAPFLACMAEQPDDTWIIEWVATRPSHRGRGLTRALLRAILDAGRARGHTRFQVSVLIGNEPAQRAYEGAGFTVCGERRDPTFEATLGSPGMRWLRRGA